MPSGLFPFTAELYRRACQPRVIEIEISNLSELWQFDSVSKTTVRQQLLQLLRQPSLSALSGNNLVVLCGYWVLWGESPGQGLGLMSQLSAHVRLRDKSGALNYFGLRAKAEAITGDFRASLTSVEQGMALIDQDTTVNDLWVFTTRISLICNRANRLIDSLYFARLSYWLAKSGDSALRISRSRFGLANCLIVAGGVGEGQGLLQRQLDSPIVGTEWIESVNLPIVPLFLANGNMASNSFGEIQYLMSLSEEFGAQSENEYIYRQRELTLAEYEMKSGGKQSALTALATFSERFLEVGESDLWSANRAVDMFVKIKSVKSDRKISQLVEMACSVSPQPAQ